MNLKHTKKKWHWFTGGIIVSLSIASYVISQELSKKITLLA